MKIEFVVKVYEEDTHSYKFIGSKEVRDMLDSLIGQQFYIESVDKVITVQRFYEELGPPKILYHLMVFSCEMTEKDLKDFYEQNKDRHLFIPYNLHNQAELIRAGVEF